MRLPCVCVLLCLLFVCDAKVVDMTVSTGPEKEVTDVLVTKFVFAASGGGHVNIDSHSRVENSRLLFFDEAPSAWPVVLSTFAELTCQGLKNLSLVIMVDPQTGDKTEGLELPIGQYKTGLDTIKRATPKVWYVMMTNCEDSIDVDLRLHFTNPGGYWQREFSIEEQGLLQMYLFYLILYTVVGAIYARGSILPLYRTQAIHPMVVILVAAFTSEWVALFLKVVHGLAYANHGVGFPLFEALGEIDEDISQLLIILFLLLLANGYSMAGGSTPPRQWLIGMGLCLGFYFLAFLLEFAIRDRSTLYAYDSSFGTFLSLIRVSFCAYFCYLMRLYITDPERQDQFMFFVILTASACVWFIALPFVVLISPMFDVWDRMRIIVSAGLAFHAAALAGLMYLVWPQRADQYMKLTTNDLDGDTTPYNDL